MRTIFKFLDRTAVLAVGIVAGFAIGLAFHPEERAGAPDIAVPPPGAPAGTPEAIRPAGPALPNALAAITPDKGKVAPAPASASVANAPELRAPVDPRVAQHAPSDGTIRVGVYGDSFGDGVWAALYHQLPAKAHFKVYKFSQEATGFTRYRSLNLEDRLRGQLDAQPVDIAVISFGANDTQGVYGDDGHIYAFMTPGWQRTIGTRAQRFVQLLRAQGAAVYWVGLPIMRKASFDADVQSENGFYSRLMAGMGVPWIETRSLSVDADGAFSPYLPDPVTGAPRLMRANDGIHMSMNGYARLTGGLAERIRRYSDMVRAHASGSNQQSPPPSLPTPPAAAPSAAPRAAVVKPASPPKPQPQRPDVVAPDTSPPEVTGPKPTNLLPPSMTPAPAAGPPPRATLELPDLDSGAAPSSDAQPAPDEGKKHHKKKNRDGDQPIPDGFDTPPPPQGGAR